MKILNSAKMKILITDDHPVVLSGIKLLIESKMPESCILSASTVDEALGIINTDNVDVLITDLDIAGRSGIELINNVHDTCPQTKVMVYTMHEEVWVVRQLLSADPDAVVLKADEPAELTRALSMIKEGKGYYSATFNRLLNSISTSPDMLSKREAEILRITACGKSATDIAAQLNISVNTVEFHRRRIMQKLDAVNAAEAVNKARELGLFSL